ncbi:MAG: hypothetical protein RI554_08145 [Trueperaceae bacterium]|nr:hypothetical protein [Trueperaceae bacterium]
MTTGSLVTFLERRDPGARDVLATVRDALAERGTPARLLRGRDAPDTWLLVVDGDPFAADALPPGDAAAHLAAHRADHDAGRRDVRAWTFLDAGEGAA